MQHEYTEMSELVAQAREDDECAFGELVRRCRGTMYAAAITITRNEQDALDAVQEAILRGWRKLPSLREQAYFTTWITRITIRAAIDITRRRKPCEPLSMEFPAGTNDLSLHMDVRRAIDGLDEKTRLCTVLYYLEDMPVEQIAKTLDIRQGTVKSRLHRARTKLRDVLEGYEDE